MPIELVTAVALFIAGAGLVCAGTARLARVAMRDMPRIVAFGAVAAGIAVAAYGATFARTPAAPAQDPTFTLEPLPTPQPGAPDETATGRIDGTVLTHTGDPLPDTTVVVQRFDRTDAADRVEVTTSADGGFSLADLPTAQTIAYTVHTEFAGVPFGSGLIFLEPGGTETIDLVVAQATEDATVVDVRLDSMVIVGDREGAQVIQVLSLTNTSDLALVDGLRLPLLPGATSLEVRQGLDRTRLAFDGGDLISLAPVLPGEHEIVYTYGTPMPLGGLDASRNIHYATERLEILLSGDLVRLDAEGFSPEGPVQLGTPGDGGSRTYHRYSATELDRGTELTASAHLPGDRVPQTLLMVAAVILALGILGFPLLRRRRRKPEPAEPQAEPVRVTKDR